MDSIHRLNPSLPDAVIEGAVYKLKNFENGTLVQQNTVFMNYLQNGIEVSYHDKGETKSDIVYIADYNNIDNETDVSEAYKQIRNYMQEIPSGVPASYNLY